MPAAGSGLSFADLEAKVTRGIGWLTEHDHKGAFHLWYESKITPSSPMPAQGPEVVAEYAAYYKQRAIWEQLWAEMVRREGTEA